jgi:hypothetical protein
VKVEALRTTAVMLNFIALGVSIALLAIVGLPSGLSMVVQAIFIVGQASALAALLFG